MRWLSVPHWVGDLCFPGGSSGGQTQGPLHSELLQLQPSSRVFRKSQILEMKGPNPATQYLASACSPWLLNLASSMSCKPIPTDDTAKLCGHLGMEHPCTPTPRPQLFCVPTLGKRLPRQLLLRLKEPPQLILSAFQGTGISIHRMEPPDGVVHLQDTPPMAPVQNARLPCSGANLFNGWVVFNPAHPFPPGTMNALFLTDF